MKIAYTVWTWMLIKDESTGKLTADPNKIRPAYASAVKEIASLGYEAAETFTPIVDAYENDVESFLALNRQYGISFECLYAHLSHDPEKDIQDLKRYLAFMEKAQIPSLNLQMPMRTPDQVITREIVEQTAALCNQVGAMCREKGVTLCVHQHLNTYVETLEQFRLFAELTDPELVKFCFDTAHLYFGGCDNVQMFETYGSRIGYVHLKDVAYLEADDKFSRFRPLGQGLIDFPHILEKLKACGYEGVLCVELDRPQYGNFQAAQYSRDYLRYCLGL